MSKKTKKTKKSKKAIIFIIIILVILSIFIINNLKNDEESGELSIIIDNQDVTNQLENNIVKTEDTIYMSFDDIKKYFDETIYQEESGLIITKSDKKLATMEINNSDININGSELNLKNAPFESEEGTIYLPISEFEKVYDIDFDYIEETQKVIIDFYSKALIKAYASKNISIKEEENSFSKTIAKVEKGNWLVVINQGDTWSKIRTQDGYIGYVKSKNLTNFVTERENIEETSANSEETQSYIVDISEENLETFEDREKVINEILSNVMSEEKRSVKIEYENEINNSYERFKIEIEPILNECGINVIF